MLTHHVRGVINIAPGLKSRLREGGAVFLIVKCDDHGQPSGPPLAVQKLTWKAGLPFELAERQAMIAGTQLTGDVIVTARYDQNGDALTKQAGDLTCQARATVPRRRSRWCSISSCRDLRRAHRTPASLHTRSNVSSPSFSRLQATLSPGLSQTRLSAGLPWITPSGVPVKMMSPGRSVMWRDT